MKCEKCAFDLPGSRVICPQCNFNNAAQRVDKWKAERQLSQTNAPLSTAALTAAAPESRPVANVVSAAAKVRARYASEAKLLQFPVTPKTEPPTAAPEVPQDTASSEPPWRELARAKVREHQQRRYGAVDGNAAPTLPEDPAALLLVESALKRIRRTQVPPAVRPLPSGTRSSSGRAVARALEYDELPLEEPQAGTPQVAPAPSALEPERATPLRAVAPSAPAGKPAGDPVGRPASKPIGKASDSQADKQTYTQAPPQSLRTRLEILAQGSSLTEVETGAELRASAEPVETTAEVAHTVSAEESIMPALAALEHQAEAHAHSTKKSSIWIGKPAPIWLRALAGAVDLEAAALAYLPFFGAYTSFDGQPERADLYLMAVILALVVYLYQLITYSFNGRTFGMALCGLRCVDVTDASITITFKRRLWQSLGGTIALLCPPINFVVTRVTEYQRGLADALGQTITLRRAED